MEKILYFNSDDNSNLDLTKLQNKYDLQIKKNIKDTFIYLINNPLVVAFATDLNDDKELTKKLLENIYHLNNMLSYIIVNTNNTPVDEKELKRYNDNAIVVNTADEIVNIVDSTSTNRREFNRIVWPLSTIFYEPSMQSSYETGLVLSISAGGAFVKVSSLELIEKIRNKNIMMEIVFEYFKFLVEASVLRVNSDVTSDISYGFAVKFVDVSEATHKCINTIVNNRILSFLMDALGIEHCEL